MKKTFASLAIVAALLSAPLLALACISAPYGKYSFWFYSVDQTNAFLTAHPLGSLPAGSSIGPGAHYQTPPFHPVSTTDQNAEIARAQSLGLTILGGVNPNGLCSWAQWEANPDTSQAGFCPQMTEATLKKGLDAGTSALYLNEPGNTPACISSNQSLACMAAWYTALYNTLSADLKSYKPGFFIYPTMNSSPLAEAMMASGVNVDAFGMEAYGGAKPAATMFAWKTTYPQYKSQMLVYGVEAMCQTGVSPLIDTWAFWDMDNYAPWAVPVMEPDWSANVMRFVSSGGQMPFCMEPYTFQAYGGASFLPNGSGGWNSTLQYSFTAGQNVVLLADKYPAQEPANPVNSTGPALTFCEYQVVDGVDEMGNGGTVTIPWTSRPCGNPKLGGASNGSIIVNAGPGTECPTKYASIWPNACAVYLRATNVNGVLGTTTMTRHSVSF